MTETLGDNDRWEWRINEYSAWRDVTPRQVEVFGLPADGRWEVSLGVVCSVADGNLRRRPPEKDGWEANEWEAGSLGVWTKYDPGPSVVANDHGYLWQVEGFPDHSTYSDPPTLRRRRAREETPEEPEPAEKTADHKWEASGSNGAWFPLEHEPSLFAEKGWGYVSRAVAYSEWNGTLRPGPGLTADEYAPHGWEFRAPSGVWAVVSCTEAIVAAESGGWEYRNDSPVWQTSGKPNITTQLGTLRPKAPVTAGVQTTTHHEVGALLGEIALEAERREALQTAFELTWDHFRIRLEALEDSPDVARPPEPAELGTVDPPERPWWAKGARHDKDAESISTLRYLCADAISHKAGDVVYDKVSGAGPFVLFSPAVGFSEEDGSNRSGQVHVWDGERYKRLPAVALTATNPNPPSPPIPTWRIATYALAAAAANSALWWYLGSAGLL